MPPCLPWLRRRQSLAISIMGPFLSTFKARLKVLKPYNQFLFWLPDMFFSFQNVHTLELCKILNFKLRINS